MLCKSCTAKTITLNLLLKGNDDELNKIKSYVFNKDTLDRYFKRFLADCLTYRSTDAH